MNPSNLVEPWNRNGRVFIELWEMGVWQMHHQWDETTVFQRRSKYLQNSHPRSQIWRRSWQPSSVTFSNSTVINVFQTDQVYWSAMCWQLIKEGISHDGTDLGANNANISNPVGVGKEEDSAVSLLNLDDRCFGIKALKRLRNNDSRAYFPDETVISNQPYPSWRNGNAKQTE